MTLTDIKLQFQPDEEHRKSFLSLRWLIIILASYLTLFSYLNTDRFIYVAGFCLVYAGSNAALAFVPLKRFREPGLQTMIAAFDSVFVGATFYLLRVPGTYLHLVFLLVFLLGTVWRQLKLVLFSIFVVSLLFGTFSYFRLFAFEVGQQIEEFLTLSLFFIVANFYLFLSERLKADAVLSSMVLEEKRSAEAMVEITRALSSSLKSDEILVAIVNRVCDVLDAKECWIVRVDGKSAKGEIIAKAAHSAVKETTIDLEAHPELRQAYTSRKLLIAEDAIPHPVIAVPMVVQDSVLGLIYVQTLHTLPLSDANLRFFEVMASTAANALRNAQLFEEVEHRARTDFLTSLPNHRYFQSTLTIELGRAQRHNHTLSLLMIDLDFLKNVNDRFGHPSGDMVIRRVAETIRSTCREIDFAARYGGEEFTVILPETPLTGAIQVADRIRERISEVEFPGIGNITASIGISNYPVNALTKEDLIRVADQALYVAKNGGRDRVAYFSYQLVTK